MQAPKNVQINLHAALLKQQVTLPELIERCHDRIPEQKLMKLAQGDVQAVRLATLTILCEALNCSPGDLFSLK